MMNADVKSLPCKTLNQLRNDLVVLAKSNITDFEQTYIFAPNAVLSIQLDKRPSGEFHVRINSPFGEETVVHANHKNMIPQVVGFCWKAVCKIIAKYNLEPCSSIEHGGADEILALHKSIAAFGEQKDKAKFTSAEIFQSDSYELLNIRIENSRCLMTIATKHVHGNLIKSIVDVQNPEQIPARGKTLLEDLLGSWLRPSTVRSYRTPVSTMNRQPPSQSQLSDHIIL
ncbi:MAG: hypothetical protein SFY67_10085 [Candidatus Melainabacteria bacterium]|nr:hypothetical protein [Candidatus Melainabacteria bacterium]